MNADDGENPLKGNRDPETYAILPYSREHPVPVYYKGVQLGGSFRADFVCYEAVIVELKAIKELLDVDYAQVLHYLKATGIRRALLINFGADRLEYKRLVYTKTT